MIKYRCTGGVSKHSFVFVVLENEADEMKSYHKKSGLSKQRPTIRLKHTDLKHLLPLRIGKKMSLHVA